MMMEMYALILASIFIGTARLPKIDRPDPGQIYWLLSVVLRSTAFAIWGLIAYLPNVFLTLAAFCFIGSAVCLALLFRVWRSSISLHLVVSMVIAMLVFTIMFEILRQQETNFQARMALAGGLSILISLWELTELRNKIRNDPAPALKATFLVIIAQLFFSLITVVFSTQQSAAPVANITEIQSTSSMIFWLTMTMHLIIYIFIGSYLYQNLLISENRVSKEKQTIENLLTERESMISSLMMANRAASTGALSAALAHELSQPLAASMLNISILKRKLDADPPQKAELQVTAESIARENKRASEILITLKNIFMQDQAELRLYSLADVIEKLKSLVQPEAKRKHVQLQIEPVPEQIKIYLNFGEFQQVMVNIINNAIEAIDSVQRLERIISIKVSESSGVARIDIADSGPGILPEDQETVFELMKTSKNSGMGIGLWLCKHIIEQRHRGSIRLDSSPVTGTRFMIELPKSAPSASA